MRWCSFTTTTGGPARLGTVSERLDDGEPRVLDVGAWARSRDAETPPDLLDLVAASIATQERVADMVRSCPDDAPGWVRPEEVVYLAPLRSADSVRSLVTWGSPPVLAHANRHALLGTGDLVPWPAYGEGLAATCEVAAVIGRAGVDVSVDDAPSHVFGYLVLNAWTVVGVDGTKARIATSLGPWVTTPDAFDPAEGAVGGLAVDGRAVAQGATRQSWSFPELLAAASAGEELRPTDLLSSGALTATVLAPRRGSITATVEGLGCVVNEVGS